MVIPAAPGGTPRQLTNEGHTQARLGGSVFSPFDTAKVVQTDVTLTKAVDVLTPTVGDVITFTLQVANTSTSVNETNVFISDPIPDDTTFEPGSITADGVFAGSGVFDAAQNAVVWNAATFPFGASATLTFQVRVNPTVPAGTEIPNRGGYESLQTPYFLSNEVEPVVIGPALQAVKSIVGDPLLVHPNETVTFEVVIENNGNGAANNVFLSDPFPSNAGYQVESIQWSLNGGSLTALTDADDGDEGGGAQGRAYADRIEFELATLGPSQNVAIRFKVRVDPGTEGQFLINQAVFASDETPSTDTNLVQVPIVGDADITGHVFIDTDGNGTQDPGEPDLANVDVLIVDFEGNPQIVTTDANGDWLATVEPGLASADVDENDSDFPDGALLSTANDPQTVTAVSGATVATGDVGYTPLPLSFYKSSDADGEVFPGDTITYTIRATNYTAVDQTNVVLSDPLPTGTIVVPGSTQVTVSSPVFRVREYYIAPGPFTDTTYDLTLDEDLEPDYFVIVRGAAGDDATPYAERQLRAADRRPVRHRRPRSIFRRRRAPTRAAPQHRHLVRRGHRRRVPLRLRRRRFPAALGRERASTAAANESGSDTVGGRLDRHRPGPADGRFQRRRLLHGRTTAVATIPCATPGSTRRVPTPSTGPATGPTAMSISMMLPAR